MGVRTSARTRVRRPGTLRGKVRRSLAIGLLVLPALSACPEPAERFPAEGIVRGVDPESGQVLIAHQPIEGLMDAMTMSFAVADPAVLALLGEGQTVTFVVVFDGESYRADEIVVTGSTTGGSRGPGFEGLADVGDPAPHFELTDQGGSPVSLASLRGGPVVLDFVYTSCPGPCPILTATHVALQRGLEPALRSRTRFVSISLDPSRDTPEALRAYARAHGADLRSWSFLTGPVDTVGDVVARYGVGSLPGEGGEIEHISVTFLIDSEGRIAHRYLGLDHEAGQLAADLEGLAAR